MVRTGTQNRSSLCWSGPSCSSGARDRADRQNLISEHLSVYTDYMSPDLDANEVAGALRVSIGLLVRRLRQAKSDGDLTLPESTALARLDRGGPTTSAALAEDRADQPTVHGGDAKRA